MSLSEKRKGELYIFSEVTLWAFFPIITTLSFTGLSGLISFGWSAIFAALFLGCVVLYRGTWRECGNRELWKYLFFVTLFIAVLYYSFYFVGLEQTTPGNAALIAEFEIFTTFFFFHIVRKEYISPLHIFGAALMVLGVAIVLLPNFSAINRGDFLILLATICTPVGNLYQQKARRIASSETILFLRTLISVPVIFLLAYTLNVHATFADVRSVLPVLIINGALLLGLQKILFLEAIHRVSVPKVIALGALTPLLTILFAWLILAQAPTWWQLLSLAPFILGVLLLTDQLGTLKKLDFPKLA